MNRGEMNWKIIRSVIPIIAMIFFVYYTKNLKTDYTKLDPILTTTAHDVLWRFQMNEGTELINQVVQFRGKVTGFDPPFIILNNNLICSPETGVKLSAIVGDSVIVKGRCVSFDDLLLELRIDHALILPRPE